MSFVKKSEVFKVRSKIGFDTLKHQSKTYIFTKRLSGFIPLSIYLQIQYISRTRHRKIQIRKILDFLWNFQLIDMHNVIIWHVIYDLRLYVFIYRALELQ